MSNAVGASPIFRFPVPISSLPPPALSERDLATLWQNQSFPPQALVTTRGQPLRVIYRGRRVGGPGPDFRDAMISAPRGLLQGDVELHVRSRDFQRHGHHRDPGYNNVVLHLVFHDDDGEDTLLASGQRIAIAALSPWVAGRAEEIHRWLERPGGWREPCFSAVARLGTEAVRDTLDRLGDMRFRQKTAIFARRLKDEDAEELLWEGLLEALCYGAQRDTLPLLAQLLPWNTLRRHLLATPARDRAARAQFLLTDALARVPYDPGVTRARPGNRPHERLAGAARLAARFTADGLLAGLPAYLDGDPDEARRSLTRFFTVAGAIGPSRAIELLANAVLPLLATLGPEAQTRHAEAIYHRLPLPARYGPVRHLHQALGSDVRINARRQQGMLYLLKQYCTQGGCGRCPLS